MPDRGSERKTLLRGDAVNSGYPIHAVHLDRRGGDRAVDIIARFAGEVGLPRATRAADGSIRFWGVAVRCIRLSRAPHALTNVRTAHSCAFLPLSRIPADTSVEIVREGEDREYARIDKD